MRILASIALAAAVIGLASGDAEASRRKRRRPTDARTSGLGRSCTTVADCGHKAQRCLKQNDANGAPIARGLCALPCMAFDQGLKKADPVPATDGGVVLQKPPRRCPKKYECRTAGAGVPIDLCVRE